MVRTSVIEIEAEADAPGALAIIGNLFHRLKTAKFEDGRLIIRQLTQTVRKRCQRTAQRDPLFIPFKRCEIPCQTFRPKTARLFLAQVRVLQRALQVLEETLGHRFR